MLSGLKDVDREILKHVNDDELIRVCSIDKKTWSQVCDDNFLKRRLSKYPDIEKYKFKNETWKRFFLRFIYYTSKLREKYQFEYASGDFKKQYDIFNESKDNLEYLLSLSAREGELSLVKFALQRGVSVHVFNDLALRNAAEEEHFEVIKFLVDNGADIHVYEDTPLILAIQHGNLETVKYLVEHDANIHAMDDYALKNAALHGYLNILKYLIEHGADIKNHKNHVLQIARNGGYSDIVNYINSL